MAFIPKVKYLQETAKYPTFSHCQPREPSRLQSEELGGNPARAIRPSSATTRGVRAVEIGIVVRLGSAANQAVGSRLPARVAGLADIGAVGVVGNAARADADDKLVSAHVGEARDIDGGKVARRELAPGVEYLAVGRNAGDAAVEGAEGTADAVVHGNGDALAEGDRDGELRGMGSHEGRGKAVALVPEHQDDVGIGV